MKSKFIDYLIPFLTALGLANSIIVKLTDFYIIPVAQGMEELLYDLSIAFFIGGLVYFLTVKLPERIRKEKLNLLLKDQFHSFYNYIENRLKYLELESDNISENQIKKALEPKTYSHVVKKNGLTIYEILHEIYNRVDVYYNSSIHISLELEPADLLDKITRLRESNLFNHRLKYRNKSLEEIKDQKVELAQSCFKFIERLTELKTYFKNLK